MSVKYNTHIESLRPASWVVANSDVVEPGDRLCIQRVDQRVEEPERGLATSDAGVVEQRYECREGGRGA